MLGTYYNFGISEDEHVSDKLFKMLEAEALDPKAIYNRNKNILFLISNLKTNNYSLTSKALRQKRNWGYFDGVSLTWALANVASHLLHPYSDTILLPLLKAELATWTVQELREAPHHGPKAGKTLIDILMQAENKSFREHISLSVFDRIMDDLTEEEKSKINILQCCILNTPIDSPRRVHVFEYFNKLVEYGYGALVVVLHKQFPDVIRRRHLQQAFQLAVMSNKTQMVGPLFKYIYSSDLSWGCAFAQANNRTEMQQKLLERKNALLSNTTAVEPRTLFPYDIWRYLLQFLQWKDWSRLMTVNKYFCQLVGQYAIDTCLPVLKRFNKDTYDKSPHALWNDTMRRLFIILECGFFTELKLTLERVTHGLTSELSELNEMYNSDMFSDLLAIRVVCGKDDIIEQLTSKKDQVLVKALQLAICLGAKEKAETISLQMREFYQRIAQNFHVITHGTLQELINFDDGSYELDDSIEYLSNFVLPNALLNGRTDVFIWACKSIKELMEEGDNYDDEDIDDFLTDAVNDAVALDRRDAVEFLLDEYQYKDLEGAMEKARKDIVLLYCQKLPIQSVLWVFAEAVTNNWPVVVSLLAPHVHPHTKLLAYQKALILGFREVAQSLEPTEEYLKRSDLITPLANLHHLDTRPLPSGSAERAGAPSSSLRLR